jgi:hypothetical protein
MYTGSSPFDDSGASMHMDIGKEVNLTQLLTVKTISECHGFELTFK